MYWTAMVFVGLKKWSEQVKSLLLLARPALTLQLWQFNWSAFIRIIVQEELEAKDSQRKYVFDLLVFRGYSPSGQKYSKYSLEIVVSKLNV